MVDEIKKEIIAFANCNGGKLYIGVQIGGLVPGIDLEDITAGISICRNQELANVFYRLHLIEAYGTGMRKIMKAYEDLEENL